MFSLTFLQFLIILALAWTALGVLALISMLIRDWKQGTLW
jgi:hypothetical protein